MMGQFDRIIDRSKQFYDLYGEEYRRFNRLLIVFSAGAIVAVVTVFDPRGAPWLMKTAMILYLVSLGFGLTVEYMVLTRLESSLEKLSKRAPDDDVSPITDEGYMEILFSSLQSLSHKCPPWKLYSQLAAFFLATLAVLLDFLLPRNPDFLDVVGVADYYRYYFHRSSVLPNQRR